MQGGFQRQRFGTAQHPHSLDAVRFRARLYSGETRILVRVGGDDQLAAIVEGHAALTAISIERAPSRDAEPRHEAGRRIIDAGMDHLAVARGCFGADTLGLFEHDHLAPGQRQRARHRKPDHARPHHDALDAVHLPLPAGARSSGGGGRKQGGTMLSLRAGEASLVLAPEIGGAIVGWTLGRDHVLRPPLSDALVHGAARGMAAYPLVPYSNRIKDARFAWAGCEYQLVRNFGDEPHAIHGVGWTSVWDVTALSAAAARLSLAWRPQTEAQRRSWPFAFDADYRYALRPDGLELV